ncbi:MAG TPA: hypothetical protein VI256_04100, partial [Roseiarcus sp.]
AGHRIAVTQNGHADALAPADVPLRAGDAIHTATALESGETEIWTNDRHLLAAVAHFGLAGRSAVGRTPGAVLERFATIR